MKPTTLLSNVQRAEVESKSQLVEFSRPSSSSCYQMYKELKLKANHNPLHEILFRLAVVIKCTKSWSWKQITTMSLAGIPTGWLLSNVQRAEVESKSQLSHQHTLPAYRCYQMYKELKLKANHNRPSGRIKRSAVVIKCTKSWSWKQITTLKSFSLPSG